MAQDNFYDGETENSEVKTEVEAEPVKIKLGEQEYSQDELNRLVELGKIGAQAEDKYKTKIDRVWPEYTKATQKNAELEKKIQELQQNFVQQKQSTGQELTPEEQKTQALRQAEELGIVTKEGFRQMYLQERAAERLIEDAESVIETHAADGKPKTTVSELLKYMDENDYKNPERAYKDMFYDEVTKWETDQIEKAKRPGMVTQAGSMAGSKVPPKVKVTDENLGKLVSEALRGN